MPYNCIVTQMSKRKSTSKKTVSCCSGGRIEDLLEPGFFKALCDPSRVACPGAEALGDDLERQARAEHEQARTLLRIHRRSTTRKHGNSTVEVHRSSPQTPTAAANPATETAVATTLPLAAARAAAAAAAAVVVVALVVATAGRVTLRKQTQF